jgi:hypothetical protein
MPCRTQSFIIGCLQRISLDFALPRLSRTMMTFELNTGIDALKQLESVILIKTRIGALLYH